MLAPPDELTPFPAIADTWMVGIVYALSDAWGDECWVERRIHLSVKPSETWQDAYKRQLGHYPDLREHCFYPDL